MASETHEKKVKSFLPTTFIHSPTKRKKNLIGLFQIQNCVNPVAWVHEAVLRRIVFGGLVQVQVVFI